MVSLFNLYLPTDADQLYFCMIQTYLEDDAEWTITNYSVRIISAISLNKERNQLFYCKIKVFASDSIKFERIIEAGK